jgi:hypothetical protein
MPKLEKLSELSQTKRNQKRAILNNNIAKVRETFGEGDPTEIALAPFRLQERLGLTEPLGIIITRQGLFDALQKQTWDDMVVWTGINEDGEFNHNVLFYDSAGNLVNMEGGGGVGVTARSAPNPQPPTNQTSPAS